MLILFPPVVHDGCFALLVSSIALQCLIVLYFPWIISQVMYSFLDRLINLGLPRTRDFQGVSTNSFDGHGNYSIGIRDQGVFPEIRADVLGKPRGMDICITTTANTDQEAQKLLALMGMPFREGGGTSALQRKKKLKAHHFDQKGRGRARR